VRNRKVTPPRKSAKKTEWTIRYQITAVQRNAAAIQHQSERLGWQVQATHAPAQRLALGESLLVYRAGWCVEMSHPDYPSSNSLYLARRAA
jgi:hypothetical protein